MIFCILGPITQSAQTLLLWTDSSLYASPAPVFKLAQSRTPELAFPPNLLQLFGTILHPTLTVILCVSMAPSSLDALGVCSMWQVITADFDTHLVAQWACKEACKLLGQVFSCQFILSFCQIPFSKFASNVLWPSPLCTLKTKEIVATPPKLYGISFRWPAVLSSAGASTSGTWLIDWLISRFSSWGFCPSKRLLYLSANSCEGGLMLHDLTIKCFCMCRNLLT